MKTNIQKLFVALAMLATLDLQLSTAHAQGTAFSYQGRLNNGSTAASGSYDFMFSIFATNTDGTLAAGPVTNTAVTVSNGLFVTVIDFGIAPSGDPAWLEIGVRTNAVGSFTTLSPRQQLLPTPYAMFAETASNVSGTVSASQIAGTVLNSSLPSDPVFSGAVTAVSLAGDGANVSNVNATALNGLDATNFWQLGGNNVSAGQFIGSTNDQPVEMDVNGLRALRLEFGGASDYAILAGYTDLTGSPNVIGGSPINFVASGTVGAVIAGGGATNYAGSAFMNSIDDYSDYSVIGGGLVNNIEVFSVLSVIGGGESNTVLTNSVDSTIGGGIQNTIGNNASESSIGGGSFNYIQDYSPSSTIGSGNQNTININSPNSTIGGGNSGTIGTNSDSSTIAGGNGNTIGNNSDSSTIGGGDSGTIGDNSDHSTIGGGNSNAIGDNSDHSTIGGGDSNQATNFYATVPGGHENVAGGQYSFAAGQQAQATNNGAFVWADSQNAPFTSTSDDQFSVRAGGGVRFVTGGAGLTLDGQPILTGIGNGSGLTNLSSAQLTGPIPSALLTSVPATNLTGTVSLAQIPLPVLIQTNFVDGKLYTNNYGWPLTINANVIWNTASVAGFANESFCIQASPAVGGVTNVSAISTIVGSSVLHYTNSISSFVPTNAIYWFTNLSSGSGNSAAVKGGQIKYP